MKTHQTNRKRAGGQATDLRPSDGYCGWAVKFRITLHIHEEHRREEKHKKHKCNK